MATLPKLIETLSRQTLTKVEKILQVASTQALDDLVTSLELNDTVREAWARLEEASKRSMLTYAVNVLVGEMELAFFDDTMRPGVEALVDALLQLRDVNERWRASDQPLEEDNVKRALAIQKLDSKGIQKENMVMMFQKVPKYEECIDVVPDRVDQSAVENDLFERMVFNRKLMRLLAKGYVDADREDVSLELQSPRPTQPFMTG